MRLRRFPGYSFVLFFCLFPLPAQAGSNPQFFLVSQVRPGMKGVGRTIFQGNKIEDFQVELIGVLKNVLGPKQDAILAKLSGPAVAQTGVAAGMSGSPVYVDGKLLGAVARAFPFAKEPYTLITPIQEMLAVVPRTPEPGASSVASVSTLPWYDSVSPGPSGTEARWIPDSQSGPAEWTSLLRRWTSGTAFEGFRLPLHFSGFAQNVMSDYSPVFRELGFEPVKAAVISGASPSEGSVATPQITPGSMISVMLVRGDLNLNVDCTVTYLQGSHLYACGHQLFTLGPADVPFAETHVLATIPSLETSFKVDEPGPVIGSIRQDRFGGIYGVLGKMAPTIPVHVTVNSSLGRTMDYTFQVTQQPLLSPLLVNLAIVSALSSSERMLGPTTLDLNGSIELGDGEEISIEDVLSSHFGSAGSAGASVATPLSYLLNGQFPHLRVRDIALHVTVQNQSRAATLEQVWSTRSEVRPGDQIVVTAMERTPSGKTVIQKIPVTVPASVSAKTLSLVVGSGEALNALQLQFLRPGTPPRNLHQLVRELNRTRRNNRLYALLMTPQRSFIMEGTEYPSPPPSLLQTFMADPAVSSKLIYRASSVVGDFETPPTSYSIEGEQTLYLKVLSGTD